MKQEEILPIIAQIEQTNFWDLAKEVYPETDLTEVKLLGWQLSFTANTLKRMLDQFKEKAQQESFFFLPNSFQNAEVDGNVNFVSHYLAFLNQKLAEKNLTEVTRAVQWLASYQAAYGFWDKSVTKIHDPKTIELKNKAEEVEALQTKINTGLSQVASLKETLTQAYQDLQSFYEQKQRELNTITQARDDVQAKQNQASSILVEINNYKSQADTALNATTTTRDESKKAADEGKVFLDDFTKKAEELKSTLDTYVNKTKQKLKEIDDAHSEVTEKKDYIDLKEQEIIKLAAQASDGSLGHTFDKRQERLNTNARYWMYGTWAMTILLFVWISIVFTCLSETHYTPQWVNPIINTIKTIPAFVILVFIARQYTKERNLQEEYAFKASIAMTLTAYADEIAREEDPDRRAIIKETIEKVYKAPKITNETVSLFGIKQKQVEAIAEKTAETVNKVIDKIPTK